MTQTRKILEYMQTYGSISSMEAFRELGITRLSARIYDLRRAGYQIDTWRVSKKKNGEEIMYFRYYLKQ